MTPTALTDKQSVAATVLALSLSPASQAMTTSWARLRGLRLILDEPRLLLPPSRLPALVLVGAADALEPLEVLSELRAEHEWLQVFFVDDGPVPLGTTRALMAGADDAARPQDDGECFLARLDVMLRRASGIYGAVVAIGPLWLDISTERAILGGVELELRSSEFKVLAYVARHSSRPVSAEELRTRALRTAADEHTVRNHVYELRTKLRSVGYGDLIRTFAGLGYRLALPRPGADERPDGDDGNSRRT